MSRSYSMYVRIQGLVQSELATCEAAAEEEWNFDDWFSYDPDKPGDKTATTNLTISAGGEGQLSGGETEDEFAQRLSVAIWKALGKFVPVEVVQTCLENLPCETYELDQDDYARIMADEPHSGEDDEER